MLPPRPVGRAVACALGLALLPLATVAAPPAPAAPVPPAPAPAAPAYVGPEQHRSARHADPAKGVGAWWTPTTKRSLRRSRTSWVYNWAAQPSFAVPRRVRFVPMIWGAAMVNPQQLAEATAYGPDLLTFNEPEFPGPAHLTVDQALDLWPQLEATGMRLSSPAVVNATALEERGWLARFMRGAERRGRRVDFIAVHWYSNVGRPARSTANLRHFLTRVHDKYGLPVWLTEYALLGWDPLGQLAYPSPRVQARFVTLSTQMLAGLPWLERYAWWALPAPQHGRSTGLFREDGRPTRAGLAFRAAGRRRG